MAYKNNNKLIALITALTISVGMVMPSRIAKADEITNETIELVDEVSNSDESKMDSGNKVIDKLKNDEPNKDNIYKYFAKNALIYKKYNFKDLYTLQEVLFKESFACTKEDFNKYIISEFEKEEN